MELKIKRNLQGNPIYLWHTLEDLSELSLSSKQKKHCAQQLKEEKVGTQKVWLQEDWAWLIYIPKVGQEFQWKQDEQLRKVGASLVDIFKELNLSTLYIQSYIGQTSEVIALAQGILLKNYQFLKYKSDQKTLTTSLKYLFFAPTAILPTQLKQLDATIQAVYTARDLVNEPLSFLNAEQLSEQIKEIGKTAGFKVSVFGKGKIEQLGMGGLLAVNQGSTTPPTFNTLEYHPINAKNRKPIVLVGKGVVYDTGGISLKPTLNSMDRMKSDMGGAAVVIGLMKAVATLELPIHIIGLIPATDNKPGPNAIVPGDVIKMYGGTTVEVLNTDAEGRLILGDALQYAQKYQPELVVDFATLTGAASVAIGDVAMVNMGTAPESMQQMEQSGYRQFEKIVTYPLWEEYEQMLSSSVADMKNIGGPQGGAITAGAFLKKFTDYPWVHFDIAGVTHTTATKDYRVEGGTGYGVRMMLDFLINKFS